MPLGGRLLRAALRLATLPLRLVVLVLSRLTGGRPWLALILLLGCGVIALHAKTLQINRAVAEREARVARLERSTSSLRSEVQRLGSTERVTRAGTQAGMITPDPDGIGYVDARRLDPARAAAAIAAPSGDWKPTPGLSAQNGDDVSGVSTGADTTAPSSIASPGSTATGGAPTGATGAAGTAGAAGATGATGAAGASGTGAGG
ncbi:hypothetical protein SK069_20010 [Patulibacter brassicae]|uniref:Cell division protein FtsL n=1 Tax=Patulibacter brassicae TaxID=1705717 RepID=A0ABU4VPV3_9ACTN|nr:hypothetical protein [Patulibacter brassicae]MDX8153894.1 hypothetical protein [Patulibacter brassicae]